MQNKNVIYSIVAILLLLSLIGLIMKARNNKKVIDEKEVPTEQVDLTKEIKNGDDQNSISIDSEVKASDYIIINDLKINKPTWVVVYNQDGEIIGKKLFEKSTSFVTLNLDKPTKVGEEYEVKMFTDTEAGDEFNPEIDSVLKLKEGDEISVVINAVKEIEMQQKG